MFGGLTKKDIGLVGKGLVKQVDIESSSCSIVMLEGNKTPWIELQHVEFAFPGFSSFYGNGIFYIPKENDLAMIMEINGTYFITAYLAHNFEEELEEDQEILESNKEDFLPRKTFFQDKEKKFKPNFSSGRRILDCGDSALLGNGGESGIISRNKGNIEIFSTPFCSTVYNKKEKAITDTCDEYHMTNKASIINHFAEKLEKNKKTFKKTTTEQFFFSKELDFTSPYLGITTGKIYDASLIKTEAVFFTSGRKPGINHMAGVISDDCRGFYKLPFDWAKIPKPPAEEEDTACYWRGITSEGKIFDLTKKERIFADDSFVHKTTEERFIGARKITEETEEYKLMSSGLVELNGDGLSMKLQGGKMIVGSGSGRGPGII